MPKEQKDGFTCLQCGETENHIYDTTRAEIICEKCSTVIESGIPDPGPEWTEYDQKGIKRRRTGPPTEKHHSLMTVVGQDFKDIYGSPLKGEKKPLTDRMRKAQKQAKTQDPRERNFEQAEREMESLVMRMNIPSSIKITFNHLYKKLVEKKYIRGRPIERIVPALLFLCHKLRKIPRSMKEFAEETTFDSDQLWSTYDEIIRKLEFDKSKELKKLIQKTDWKSYIEKFVTELKLPSDIFPIAIESVIESQKNNRKAISIANRIGLVPPERFNLGGKDPKGIAAAAIYDACIRRSKLKDDLSYSRTEQEIARVAKISEPTLRKRYKSIRKNIDALELYKLEQSLIDSIYQQIDYFGKN